MSTGPVDICHPSENIPVALAAAQAAHASGRQLIEAIALAYEAQVRLADAFSLAGHRIASRQRCGLRGADDPWKALAISTLRKRRMPSLSAASVI